MSNETPPGDKDVDESAPHEEATPILGPKILETAAADAAAHVNAPDEEMSDSDSSPTGLSYKRIPRPGEAGSPEAEESTPRTGTRRRVR